MQSSHTSWCLTVTVVFENSSSLKYVEFGPDRRMKYKLKINVALTKAR